MSFADTMTLREVFQHAKRRTLPKEWLYLPADSEWTPNTEAVFLDWDNEEKGEDKIPVVAKRKKLRETLDDGTIEQVGDWADRLAGEEDDYARLGFVIISGSMHSLTDWARQILLPPTRSYGDSTASSTILSELSTRTPNAVTKGVTEARQNSACFAEVTSLSR